MEQSHHDDDSCKNCGTPLPESGKYCPACGQKRTTGLISVKELFADFFDSVFNINSRVFQTIPLLFVPGKLTQLFFAGKHKRYFSPLRLFFTSLILFFAVLGFKYLDRVESEIDSGGSYQRYMESRRMLDKANEIKESIGYDSLASSQQAVIDSFVSEIAVVDDKPGGWSVNYSLYDTAVDISLHDIATKSTDSIISDLEIEGFINKQIIRQVIKAQKHPDKMVRFAIGNSTWMILLLMPAVALVMKFMYIRRNRYFVEHLVFLYHYHSMVFLVMTIFVLALPVLPLAIKALIPLALVLFLLFALLSFYRQNIFKTLVKYVILLSAYISILCFYVLITVLISFLLFR